MLQRGEQIRRPGADPTDRSDRIAVTTLEHHREAGEVVVDDLLEHQVGFVEPALRARPAGVVDLDDQRRGDADRWVRILHPGQRVNRLGRHRRGRRRLLVVEALAAVVVVFASEVVVASSVVVVALMVPSWSSCSAGSLVLATELAVAAARRAATPSMARRPRSTLKRQLNTCTAEGGRR